MGRPLALKEADYLAIEQACHITPSESYAVTYSKLRTKMIRSVHVFTRMPTTSELNAYENTSSKLTLKGRKAEVIGGAVNASDHLYDILINRAYDILVGRSVKEGEIDRMSAMEIVPPLTKRTALRELLGEVYSASQIEEMEEDEGMLVEEAGKK